MLELLSPSAIRLPSGETAYARRRPGKSAGVDAREDRVNIGPVGIHDVQVQRPLAIAVVGEEIDLLTVARPCRGQVGTRVIGQAGHARAVGVRDIDVGDRAVARLEDDLRAGWIAGSGSVSGGVLSDGSVPPQAISTSRRLPDSAPA